MRAFSQFGSGNRNFGQPVSKLADELRGLDNVVIVATKAGQPWVGSTLGETDATRTVEQLIPADA